MNIKKFTSVFLFIFLFSSVITISAFSSDYSELIGGCLDTPERFEESDAPLE